MTSFTGFGVPITNAPPHAPFDTSATAPMRSAPTNTVNSYRGICSLSHQKTGTLRFRTNPNEISWSYFLNTKVESTYGGRVVQILSTKMDDLIVKVDCGQGGWPYLMKVCAYLRDLMVNQRDGEPADFMYTARGWHMKVFAISIPFQDDVEATVREMTINFKIQEDVSGVVSGQTLASELKKLQEGIGFQRSMYNTGSGGPGQDAAGNALLHNQITSALNQAAAAG